MSEDARRPERVEGLDLARALAILAMVLINFQVFLQARPDPTLVDHFPRWLIHLPSGRSSSLFVTLAGAGIALMARSPDRRAVVKTLLLRALFLLIAGNLLILVWWIDILHFYAFYLAFAALVFLRFSKRELLVNAAAITVLATVLDIAFEWGEHDYHSWVGLPLDVVVDGIHPLLPWLAFILVGMWVGRLDLRDRGVRQRLMLGGMTTAVGTELVSAALGALAAQLRWAPEITSHLGSGWSPAPLFVVGASGTAVFAIGLCQEITSRWGQRRAVRALIAAGQLSLTLYILHALVGVGIPRWAMGLERDTSWRATTVWWAGFCLLVIPLAYVWRRHFRRGPLEWVMRKLCGQTPAAPALAPPRRTRPVVRWPWALVVLAWVAVVAIKALGLATPAWGCGTDRTLVDRAAGEITLSCTHRGYAVEAAGYETWSVETHSSIDTYLELWGPTKRLWVNDDGGDDLNARLVRKVRPGRYRVVVRPYGREVGAFWLSFSRD